MLRFCILKMIGYIVWVELIWINAASSVFTCRHRVTVSCNLCDVSTTHWPGWGTTDSLFRWGPLTSQPGRVSGETCWHHDQVETVSTFSGEAGLIRLNTSTYKPYNSGLHQKWFATWQIWAWKGREISIFNKFHPGKNTVDQFKNRQKKTAKKELKMNWTK